MRRVPIFPLSHRALATLCIIALSIIFIAVFFLSPPLADYKHVSTETGKVFRVDLKGVRYNRNEAEILVKLENGKIIYMVVPTRRIVTIGQSIEVDILEAEGKKTRYRLAQTDTTP